MITEASRRGKELTTSTEPVDQVLNAIEIVLLSCEVGGGLESRTSVVLQKQQPQILLPPF